jgi:hypothetical protein
LKTFAVVSNGGILLVSFLAGDSAQEFGMRNVSFDTVLLKDTVNGNEVFAGRLHADKETVVAFKPIGKGAEVGGKGRKILLFVGGNIQTVRKSNGSNDYLLMDVNAATNLMNDFQKVHLRDKKITQDTLKRS